MDKEFNFILDFVAENSNDCDNALENGKLPLSEGELPYKYNFLYQLKSLWTAYCLHNDLECDTAQYDVRIKVLFEKVKECNATKWKDEDFENFDLWFGSYIS